MCKNPVSSFIFTLALCTIIGKSVSGCDEWSEQVACVISSEYGQSSEVIPAVVSAMASDEFGTLNGISGNTDPTLPHAKGGVSLTPLSSAMIMIERGQPSTMLGASASWASISGGGSGGDDEVCTEGEDCGNGSDPCSEESAAETRPVTGPSVGSASLAVAEAANTDTVTFDDSPRVKSVAVFANKHLDEYYGANNDKSLVVATNGHDDDDDPNSSTKATPASGDSYDSASLCDNQKAVEETGDSISVANGHKEDSGAISIASAGNQPARQQEEAKDEEEECKSKGEHGSDSKTTCSAGGGRGIMADTKIMSQPVSSRVASSLRHAPRENYEGGVAASP
ncbi:hypothetical protein EV182_002277 [Spiromyces aspiralis]|uniref:Uncharacterized protein n=1 Tax=Spiromyces aspiralis TaxID=68401 RepID=A0ACC1HGR7_9FUNG|nr:hypothetical protein EV182_002277 [Spiromyces aspiralis]